MVKSSGKSSVRISGSAKESLPLVICIEMRGLFATFSRERSQ